MADINRKRINYEVNLGINKASVDNLKRTLSEVERNLQQAIKIGGPSEEFEKSLKAAKDLKSVLTSSWNTKLNQLDLSKVNDELIKSYGSVNNFKQALESTSSIGAKAYNDFSKIVLNTNLQLKQSSKILDEMADTLGRTIKWGVASRIMNNMAGSIEKAWSFSVKLDKSLNDIRIVTNKSAEDMNRFAETANRAAKNLGASTRDYTEAALIYYQQGLSDQEAQKRADITLKAANVTGQSTQEVSEQLTAVWNGYNVTIQESELYIDKLAAVAAGTAADLEELSTGMSKVASAANSMGVDIDQLNAQMATIISVTRQAPESVGTALRTIYARMGDIKAGLDSEVSLGNYTSKMAQLGINVLDANNQLRDMGEIIEEVGSKWSDMSREQQVSLAQTMAGTRQYNNLLALFENWDMYTDALDTSANAAGTLQKQQDIYMESTEAHLQKMKTEAEETYKTLFDVETVNGFIDALTGLNSVLNTFLKGLGGGMNDFVYIGALLTQIFNRQLAGGLDNFIQRMEVIKNNKSTIDMLKAITEEGMSEAFGANSAYVTDALTGQFERNAELLKLQPSMSEEDFNKMNTLSQQITYYEEIAALKEKARTLDTSESAILEEQIHDLEAQNEELKERINLIKEGSYNKEDIEKWANENRGGDKEKLTKILSDSEARTLSEEENNTLLKTEEETQERIKILLQSKRETLSKITETEELDIEQVRNEAEIRRKIYDEMEKERKRRSKIGDTISGISSLVQFGTVVSGLSKTISEVTDGTIEWSDALKQIGMVMPSLIMSGAQLAKFISGIPPQYLLIGAAVAAVTAAIAFTINEIDLFRNRERVLNEQLKENQKAVKETTETYDELKSTISNYNSAREGIEKLKEGTLEFYEAIVKANEEAKKLIDAFELKAGSQYQIDSNGLITIDEEALKQGMFNQAQEMYRAQFDESMTQYSINYRERQKENEELIKQFQREVSEKSPSGYGISYEQAQKMIDEFVLKEEETVIDIGELTGDFTDNADKNFGDLCELITEEMSEVKAKIEENKAEEAAEATKAGIEAIRSYGTQEQVEQFQNLPSNVREIIGQSIGKDITSQQAAREKVGLGGRNITNTFEQMIGLAGREGGFLRNPLSWMLPGMAPGNAVLSLFSERINKEQRNYNATQAIPQKAVEDTLEKRIEYMNDRLSAATEAGFTSEAGGKYIAQAQYEAKWNEKPSQDVIDKMTVDELRYALESSDELQQSLLKSGQSVEEYIQKIQASAGPLDEFGRSQERIAADLQDYNNTLQSAATELDTTTKAMELYGDAVINAGKVENKKDATTAESIKNMASFNKKYNEAIKLYDSNKDALEEYANAIKNKLVPSLEAAEGAAEISEKLEEMGLSLSGQQLADNLDTINTLLTGTEEEAAAAYNELEKISLLNILEGFDTSVFDEMANGIEGFVDELVGLDPGALISNSYAEALTKMINDSQMTREQIYELLDGLHLKGPNMDTKLKEQHKTIAKAKDETTSYTGEIPITVLGKTLKTIKINYKVTKHIPEQVADYYTLGEGQSFVSTGGGASGRSFTRAPSTSSSSRGSSAESKVVDLNDEEADRYHEIDTQIKEVDNSIKQLQSQTKKLVGENLLGNLNKQWELLNRQVQNYNEKLRIAQGEQAELRSKLTGQGVAFNADGTIGNYVQAFQAQQAQLNNIINYYNSLSAEGQKGYQATLDAAQESFKEFQKDMDRYDTLVSDFIPSLYESIQDAIDKQIDIQIQEFDMEIEIRLKMSEAERDWNNFKKKIIDDIKDDDILGNAMAKLVNFSSYYKEDDTGAVQALRKQIDDTLNELYQMDETGKSSVYGNNRTAALEDLKKYYDSLMSNMQEVLSLQEEIHQSYIDMINEAQEKFDEQIDSYQMISNLIEHDMNVVSLIYGDEAYHQLSNYYDKQQENFHSQLDFQRQQVEFWQAQMDAVEQGSEAWDAAKEKWAAATEELNSLIEQSIENLQDKYLNTINAIFQDLNNKVTDGFGLDYVEEEWNLINKNADQYLDTINSLYGIQALENKYLDAINGTDNINAQKQLKKIMDDELASLRERDKLTQYDIDRANKKYEIALKQIALEEAQQNKTQMRLRRDSQGNYRYEYISDAEEVQKLQNELDDLYNSLYNFDKENYASNLNQLYDVWNEFQEKMAEAAQINDPEARAERELLIQEQYGTLINGLVEQNETVRSNLYDSAFEDLARLYEEDKNKFLEMTQEEQDALMSDLIPYWDAGVQHMADVFAGEGGFIPTCEDAMDELHAATDDYENSLRDIEDIANIAFDDLASGIDDTITKTQELMEDNYELINSYTEEMNAIAGVVDELDNLVNKYTEARDAAKEAEEAAYNYWSEQQRQAAEAARKDQEEKAKKAAENAVKANTISAPVAAPASTQSSGSGDGVPRVGDIVNYVSGSYTADSYGGGNSGAVGLGGQVKITIVKEDGRPRPIHIARLSGGALGWVSRGQISGYDTGGYTGEWGDTGRLALLHQKELVLNKEDTQNILNAVEIMRAITDNLGSKVLNKLAIATANNNFNPSGFGNALDQNVHIEANFPNVKNSYEIEEALNNLVNAASQRVQQKQR